MGFSGDRDSESQKFPEKKFLGIFYLGIFGVEDFRGWGFFFRGMGFPTKKPPLIPNSENMIGIPTLSSEMMFLTNN